MAHFARLDENNTVVAVLVVHNNELASGSEIEVVDGMIQEKQILSEAQGIAFCQSLYGADTRWVQTSYNGSFRGKYAGIGDTYDAEANVFSSPVVAPSVDVPVVAPAVETQQAVVLEAQAPVGLSSTDIPALTSEQISGLE